VRRILVILIALGGLAGCAGKYEQLAKCSADESPVPALGYAEAPDRPETELAFAHAVNDDCGPMRPVNLQSQGVRQF